MILIENRTQRDPYIEVYTYNMIHRFTFNKCTVKEDAENGEYLVMTNDNDYFIASFPMRETAYILTTNETSDNITFI